MTLKTQPGGWTDFAWRLYRMGLLSTLVFVTLPLYIVVGAWKGGIKPAVGEWRDDLKEVRQ